MASEADAIIGIYQRHADAWDEMRDRSLFERPWLDRFASLLPRPAHILDIGCGAGEPLAQYFVERGDIVTGVDASPQLVQLCRGRFPNHDWLLADMRQLRLDRRFNGLLAWDSFFHLSRDDQRRMFPTFRRLAAPKAPLLFTSGPSDGEAMGSFEGEPLYHSSLDPAEYRACLRENGFSVVAHTGEDATCGDHTVWLAQLN